VVNRVHALIEYDAIPSVPCCAGSQARRPRLQHDTFDLRVARITRSGTAPEVSAAGGRGARVRTACRTFR